ncbi:MAG: YraN family protein [Minisyncoccia bacterium]
MDLSEKSKKEIGALGEDITCQYFKNRGFNVVGRNVARKTGEIDVIASRKNTLHFVEVKTITCAEFPDPKVVSDDYDPSLNLHELKIRKVGRTAEWYVAEIDWKGEWQVDGFLVWLRLRDGLAKVLYLPQIV